MPVILKKFFTALLKSETTGCTSEDDYESSDGVEL